MKVEIKQEIKSESLESVDIHIEFNPQLQNEENLAAYVAATVDLVRKYNFVSTKLEEVEDAEEEYREAQDFAHDSAQASRNV